MSGRSAQRGDAAGKSIVIGVTIDDSLQYYPGLPEALAVDGWHVHLVAGPGHRLESMRGLPGITVHPISMQRAPSPVLDFVALVKWMVLIGRIRPDVTFISTPKAALLGTIAARLMRVPRRIYGILGLRLETSSGRSRKLLFALEKLTADSAHQVLAVSPSLRQLIVETGVTSSDKAIVVGAGSCNGVDIERFRLIATDREALNALAAELGLDATIPTIGFVGRLTRDKGLPELADALRLLAKSGRQVQVLIVGGIDDPSGQAALDDLHHTGQKIIAAGYRPDPAPFYALMTIFCLPSWREGLPNVVLEAMASGTIVVASDATGNVDLVENGVTGYLVPRGSADRLSAAFIHALDNPAHAAAVVAEAGKMLERDFDTTMVQGAIRRFLGETR